MVGGLVIAELQTLKHTSHEFLGLGTQMGLHGHFENQICSFCSFILHQVVIPLTITLSIQSSIHGLPELYIPTLSLSFHSSAFPLIFLCPPLLPVLCSP